MPSDWHVLGIGSTKRVCNISEARRRMQNLEGKHDMRGSPYLVMYDCNQAVAMLRCSLRKWTMSRADQASWKKRNTVLETWKRIEKAMPAQGTCVSQAPTCEFVTDRVAKVLAHHWAEVCVSCERFETTQWVVSCWLALAWRNSSPYHPGMSSRRNHNQSASTRCAYSQVGVWVLPPRRHVCY